MLRFEYKYFVHYSQLDRLRKMISPFMVLDKNAREHGGEYTVRSIYFDTPDLQCYLDKLAGVKRRNKVRLRGYNGDGDKGTVFFEIKTKVDEPLYKNRAPMSFENAKKILYGDPVDELVTPTEKIPLARENAHRFLYQLYARRMQPVVTVIYEREPFQFMIREANDLRITFDKNLRGIPYPSLEDLYKEEKALPVDREYFIMEIKFNSYLPAWVKSVITSLGLKKGPASKYALCVEALGLASVRRWQH